MAFFSGNYERDRLFMSRLNKGIIWNEILWIVIFHLKYIKKKINFFDFFKCRFERNNLLLGFNKFKNFLFQK